MLDHKGWVGGGIGDRYMELVDIRKNFWSGWMQVEELANSAYYLLYRG